jgi:membrane protease YdiL (CAAX protease family)
VSPAVVWARLACTTAIAVSLAVVLAPPRPPLRLPRVAATALGLAAGVALFAAAARRAPALPRRSAAGQLLLALCAANEELLWRRVLLGELLPLGPVAALALSSAAFAAAHRRAPLLHAATGSAFGGVYLATGFLGAAVAAHWAYNTLVGSLVQRVPP